LPHQGRGTRTKTFRGRLRLQLLFTVRGTTTRIIPLVPLTESAAAACTPATAAAGATVAIGAVQVTEAGFPRNISRVASLTKGCSKGRKVPRRRRRGHCGVGGAVHLPHSLRTSLCSTVEFRRPTLLRRPRSLHSSISISISPSTSATPCRPPALRATKPSAPTPPTMTGATTFSRKRFRPPLPLQTPTACPAYQIRGSQV
jgi:hypothetical protein